MNDAIQKFKDILKTATTVAVYVGTTDDVQKILAGTVLHRLFLLLGKSSSYIGEYNERIRAFLKELCGESLSSPLSENLVIKLDASKIPVSELRYEKEGEIFKIILSSAGAVDPKHVIIEKEKNSVDLLILIDPSHETIERAATIPHRDIIKITSKDQPLAMKVADIAFVLANPLPTTLAGALWYLVHQEERVSGATPRTLEKKNSLMAHINKETLQNAEKILLGASFWKLLGRALARSEFENLLKTVWTFVPYGDFQKTNQEPGIMISLFMELQSIRHEGEFFALLWEQKPDHVVPEHESRTKTVRALVGAKNAHYLVSLAESFQTAPASNYFFVNGFGGFSEGELKIRSEIQRVLSQKE